jgi:hypothetical protein
VTANNNMGAAELLRKYVDSPAGLDLLAEMVKMVAELLMDGDGFRDPWPPAPPSSARLWSASGHWLSQRECPPSADTPAGSEISLSLERSIRSH